MPFLDILTKKSALLCYYSFIILNYMKFFKKIILSTLTFSALTLTGCLHIIEEVTFKNSGAGQYKMTLDMSEMKGAMDMMKGMGGADSTAQSGGEGSELGAMAPSGDSFTQMGEQMTSVTASIKGVEGITNVMEINDTSTLKFGYIFDFASVVALNRALKIINKEKYESKSEEVFKFSGKSFERLAAGDIGAEMKKALSEGGGEEDEEGSLEMMKSFFADMSYTQIYNFPDRKVKKSTNEISEISGDAHTLTIKMKPFDEEQSKKSIGVATKVKLK